MIARILLLAAALFCAAQAHAQFAVGNGGLSLRAWNDPANLLPGEVYFAQPPTPAQLSAAFPGYAGAATAARAPMRLRALLDQGLAVTSTLTPSLSATYPLDAATLADITAVAAGDAEAEGLPGGALTVSFPDTSHVLHAFTEPQFKAWATAIRNFVGAAKQAALIEANGGTASWPSAVATIP